MKFNDKIIKIVITGHAKEEFEKLNEIVGQEITKGISGSNYQTLFNSIKDKIKLLKKNPQFGVHVSKNKIPKSYIQKYDVNNIWKVNLAGAWRMIYTLRGDKVEIISLILDIINHKDYEKKFNYKKS